MYTTKQLVYNIYLFYECCIIIVFLFHVIYSCFHAVMEYNNYQM